MKKILLSAALIAVSFTSFAQVGVGTTSPSAALDVVSTGSDDTTKALEINNATGEIVTVLDNGHVGIGTTDPFRTVGIKGNATKPDGDLSIQSYNDDSALIMGVSDDINGNRGIYLRGANHNTGGLTLSTPNGADNFFLYSQGVQKRFYVEPGTGNFVIGSNNLYAPQKLNVNGNIAFGSGMTDTNYVTLVSNSNLDYYFQRSTGGFGTAGVVEKFDGTTNIKTIYTNSVIKANASVYPALDILESSLSGAGSTYGLRVTTTNVGSASSIASFENATVGVVMRVTNQGKVGIGTATPGSKLSVVGLVEYADQTAATTAGLVAGDFYHTAGTVKIVY